MKKKFVGIALVTILAIIVLLVPLIVLRRQYTEKFAQGLQRVSKDAEMSYVSGLPYTQKTFVSDSKWLDTCKQECSKNEKCYGFFEQTHKCPEPNADDHVTDPNKTEGKGCYRVCGFFDREAPTKESKLAKGAKGSVWMKGKSLIQV